MRWFWILADRLVQKLVRMYRTRVFRVRVRSCGRNPRILGTVDVRAPNVTIGNDVTIYPGAMFYGDGEIVIGNNVAIGKDTIIYSGQSVRIGDDVAIAAQCYIIDSNHGTRKGTPMRLQPLEIASDGVRIGTDVWISAGCKVLKGAWIHNGVVIGAMSLVNSEIPENSVAFGIPARVKTSRT